MATDEYEGRSGQSWTVRRFLHRTDHLRPPVPSGLHNVELVRNRDGDAYGALRGFRSRSERELALDLLAAGAPSTPVAVDLVDDASLPPSLVTSWAPGSSDLPLEKFRCFDDLGQLIDNGYRFTPARALRTVVALGQLLDTVAERGFTPVELSPDHLIYNRGSIRLVGIGRHLYRPESHEIPDQGGMSAPTARLIAGDLPLGATSLAAWRVTQTRAILRLVGWMTCGLAPGAWGPVDDDLRDYLIGYAGFATVPTLHPGGLADGLAYAAHQEEQQEGRRRLASAKAVVLFDAAACERQGSSRQSWVASLRGQVLSATVAEVGEIIMTVQVDVQPGADPWRINIGYEKTAAADLPPGSRIDLRMHYHTGDRLAVRIDSVGRASTGWPPVGATVVPGQGRPAEPQRNLAALAINPESVRLGMMVEHGPDVVAIAAVPLENWTRPQATTLSGAGWLLISPDKLGTVTRRLAAHLPQARFVIAGRSPAAVASLAGRRIDQVQLNAADPVIAGRPATRLPYIRDEHLNQFAKDTQDSGMTRVARRRSFAAGWALAWEPPDGASRADPRTLLRFLDEQFDDTELLLRVRLLLNKPIFQHDSAQQIRANITNAAPILGAVPPIGPLRDHLMKVLLNRSPEDLYDTVRKRILPVAPRLAQIYDPALIMNDRPMEEALRNPDGLERLGLFGRLATVLPHETPARLLPAVSGLDDLSVRVLRHLSASSLRHLADRIDTPTVRALLHQYATDDDRDLFRWYTPAAWDLLLADKHIRAATGDLGPGWPLIIERDTARTMTPEAVLDLARTAAKEPRHVIRLLLDTPAADWPAVMRHPGLAARWVRDIGDLDVAGALTALPDAGRLADRYGAVAVRACHLAGLPARRLPQISDLAAGLALDAVDVVTAFLNTDLPDAAAADLCSIAGVAWTRTKMTRGATLRDCVTWLAGHPAAIRTWTVDGPGLARRVLTDLLGDDPADLGVTGDEQGHLFAALTACAGLGQLLGQLIFPRQRLVLLRLIAAHPHRDRWTALRDEPLASLLGDEDPANCLDLVLTDGLRVGQAGTVRRTRLVPADRAILRALGPLADDLTSDRLAELLLVGHRYGAPAAVTTAIAAAHQPATARIIAAWGPDWLPMLSGEQNALVAESLSSVDLSQPRPTPVSAWLLAAGTNGLQALRRHGERLLTLIAELHPPVTDVRLLDAVLSHRDWPAARLYPMIIKYGLPQSAWELAARRLRQNWPENDILVELWCLPAGRHAA